jgi:hypothetical protein
MISERGTGERVVAALGDGFTLGPTAPRAAWPDMLQQLVDLNSPGRVRVVNAAVPGYSSLQGLLGYRQTPDLRAGVVVIAFGADDARPVRRTDAAWLERVRRAEAWGRSRALAILLRWAWSLAPPPETMTRRVPLDDYAAHLRELVRLARQRGAHPLLLTRPYRHGEPLPEPLAALPRYNDAVRGVAVDTATPCLDLDTAVLEDEGFLVDAVRPSPAGFRRVAAAVLHHLRSLGLVESEHRFASGGRLADWSDERPELRSGFWPVEPWKGREPGRWTAAEARLVLERRAEEGGLLVDLTLQNPTNRTSGRVEVAGRTLLRFAEPNRRLLRILDIRGIEGPVIEVRFVADDAMPPPASGDERPDPRVLGVFVHRVALVPMPLATELDLAALDDDRPELGTGWLGPEAWPDGRRGRWTGARADLRLSRPPGHDTLLLDLSLQSPTGQTDGDVEVNGQRVEGFHGGNGPRQLRIDLRGMPGDELRVGFVVRRPFRPRREAADSRDDRQLGVFVHAVRTVPAGDPSGPPAG